MARLRDLLDRFRPVGAPGAPSAVGVPADRSRELTAELDPVFTALAPVEGECADLRVAATATAEQRRSTAARQAESVRADARARALAVRAEAAAEAQQGALAEAAALRARAEQQQQALRARAADQMPAFVEQVLTAVRAQIQGGVPSREDAS